MSESIKQPRLLDLLHAGLRDLLSLVENEEDRRAENRELPERRETSLDARFPVPSRDLAFRLVNVPREGWNGETGRPANEVLDEVTSDLREDLAATLADFAYAAIERGTPTVTLSAAGRFADDFVQELMRALPIDPYVAPEVLERLHAELLDLAQTASMEASWGRLADKDGDLEIVLPRGSRASTAAAGSPR